MALSRKNYEAIASNFSYASTVDNEDMTAEDMRTTLANDLADYFELDNTSFNRERFLAACYVK